MEWKEVRLGDYIEFNPKRSLKKSTIAKKVTMDLLVPYSKQIYKYIVEPYNGGAKFQNGDTIMARITPCLENGKHSYVNFLEEDEIAFGSTEYIVMCGKPNITDNEFVYYFSHTPFFKNTAIKSMVGTSGRQRAQVDVLTELCVNFPVNIADQKKIAGILSSLDDKIETNNRLSEKLEELAQAIFKSWFVDFEPFKNQKFHETELGMIPEGWEVKTVDEFCRIFTGKKNANQSDANGIYPFFSCAPDPLRSNDYLYDGYAVIIAGNGSYTGRTQLYNGKFDLYQRTYACVAKEKFFNDKIVFIYLMMKHGFEREKMGGTRGSSIPYIVMNDIAKQTFCYNKNVIGNFCNIVRPVMDIKHKLQIESARLASLRDTLLPRLMSGEIKL